MPTIDTSYFEGELSIGQVTTPPVILNVTKFIAKYEDALLTYLMGYELYKNYKAGINQVSPEAKWTDIRDGKEYSRAGFLTKWKGLRFTDIGNTINTPALFAPVTFIIGDGGPLTPAAGGTTYVNADLAGLTNSELLLVRNGNVLHPGFHYNVNLSGGFTLAVTGDMFGPDEQFMLVQNVATPTPGDTVGLKRSPIANYVYYHYLANNVSFTMGGGETRAKAKDAVNLNPYPKMVRAWNEMVDMNIDLVAFLRASPETYPEYSYGYYEWCQEVLRYKNGIGL